MSLAAVVRLVLVAASAALAVGRRGAADSRIGVDELCQNATPTAASSVDRITMATINARLSRRDEIARVRRPALRTTPG